MIRINLIPIFIAINNEYGTPELTKRLKKILNIELPEFDKGKVTIDSTKNALIITDLNSKVKHTIEIFEEYYTYRKDFTDYFIIKYYDMSKIEFRKLGAFRTSDQELLVIDEINERDIFTRRIIKTTDDDEHYINGSFERETLYYRQNQVRERYKYIEDESKSKKVSKQIAMPDNLYTYSYRNIVNSVSKTYQYGYIETSSCIDRPYFLTLGRIRDNNELLISSLKTPLPNILIRSRNTKEDNDYQIELHGISIYKIENTIQIMINTATLPTIKEHKNEYRIRSYSNGKLTEIDIDLLIEFFRSHLELGICNEVIQELTSIKHQILISKQKEIQDFDFFDGRFLLFDRFEDLLFDVYENRSLYEKMINSSLNPDKEEDPSVLKKV